MTPMKSLWKFLTALPAPFYAFIPSNDYRPEEYHVVVWLGIAMAITFALMISDWIGWSSTDRWRLADVAWGPTLLCRLALVEREVKDLRHASSSDSSHT